MNELPIIRARSRAEIRPAHRCPAASYARRGRRLRMRPCPSHLFHPSQKPWNFASPPDTLSGMHKIIEIFADRAALHTEILALRQQVAVLKRKRLSLLLTPSGAEILAFQGDLIAFVVCTRSCFTAFSRAFAVAPCDNLRSPRLVINRTSFGATSQASGWDTQNTRVSAPDGVNRRDKRGSKPSVPVSGLAL